MDKYYGNVCELDIIFSFTKAYYILDEILLAGELQESSKKNVLRCIGQQDSLEDMEVRCPFGLFATFLWRSGLSLYRGCSPNSQSFSLAILRPLTSLFLCSGRGRGYEDNVTKRQMYSFSKRVFTNHSRGTAYGIQRTEYEFAICQYAYLIVFYRLAKKSRTHSKMPGSCDAISCKFPKCRKNRAAIAERMTLV